jgi:hypothetical protein
MEKLYYVIAYSHQRNARARYNVTADNKEDAEYDVLVALSDDWKIQETIFVCHISNNVFMEL